MVEHDTNERYGRAGAAGTGALLVAWVLAAPVASAHHSISAVYDSNRQQEIAGDVIEFQFVNPHPFVLVAVSGEAGQTVSWRLELDNRFELAAIGVTAETLKPGDRVVVAGSLGRSDPHTLYVRRLDRPADGFRYEQIGSRPRVNRVP